MISRHLRTLIKACRNMLIVLTARCSMIAFDGLLLLWHHVDIEPTQEIVILVIMRIIENN